MPQFIEVAATDELADDQTKLVEVEGQKIALFRVDGGIQMRQLLGSAAAPDSAKCPA